MFSEKTYYYRKLSNIGNFVEHTLANAEVETIDQVF